MVTLDWKASWQVALWKRKYLSKGKRLVLIKSTLESILVYMCSLMVIPSSIVQEIEKIVQNFLWGTTLDKRKFGLVSWRKICLPFEKGALDFEEWPSFFTYEIVMAICGGQREDLDKDNKREIRCVRKWLDCRGYERFLCLRCLERYLKFQEVIFGKC